MRKLLLEQIPQFHQVKLIVFPNPSEDNITIKIMQDKIEKPKYFIYNLDGQVKDNGIITSDVQEIDISSLTTGIYLLTVYDNNGDLIASEKIIKE